MNKVLENGTYSFDPLPKDPDRGAALFEIRHPDRYLPDLVLKEEQTRRLRRVLDEFRQWEVLEANALRPANKLLFCGPPGSGKTATAEALSTELGLPFLVARFDAVVSSLLGETAANLRKVFDYASRGTWVLFFDEFDAIGRSRDDATEHGELKRVVNTFLQMLDRFAGRSLVVAATNFEQSLDPALWRRFDEVVRFEPPNHEELILLLQKKLERVRYPKSALHEMADKLSGASHADAERICLELIKLSVLRGKPEISPADFDEARLRHEERIQTLRRSRPADGTPAVDET
jgi:SpoVK/Ycf46/Vps4 family AAA+-type ATPase